MFYILQSTCSDYALAAILVIAKRLLNFVQVFVPIILIISVTIKLIQKVLSPESGKDGSMKDILNAFMSAIIIVFLPFIINLTMDTISNYGDVGIVENGNLTALNITSCWQSASSSAAVLDSANEKSSTSISKEKTRNTVSLRDDSSQYEALLKDYQEKKANNQNSQDSKKEEKKDKKDVPMKKEE